MSEPDWNLIVKVIASLYLSAVLIVLPVLSYSQSRLPDNCAEYWLAIWNTRGDTENDAYLKLAYYAYSGAFPTFLTGKYSGKEVAAYFSSLAIIKGQLKVGVDIVPSSLAMSSSDSSTLGGQIAVRDSIASYFGRDWRNDECILAKNSMDCIYLLAKKLEFKANQMISIIVNGINRNEITIKCKAGLSTPNSPELR